MAIWSGIGINYGEQAVYDITQVESDYTFLKAAGVTRLRIFFPNYNGTTSLTNAQDMVTRALAHGFYVVWGVGASGTKTATVWAALKASILATFGPWAQSVGLSELALGNELELSVDGTTLTAATVRSDLRALAASVKSGGYTGVVSYNTAAQSAYYTPWISEGIGSLDLIGFNSYDNFFNFNNRAILFASSFGSKVYISEFGAITFGFSDYSSEYAWYLDVLKRIAALQNAGIARGYFFCYRDGGFGSTPNSFALVQTTNVPRLARYAALGIPLDTIATNVTFRDGASEATFRIGETQATFRTGETEATFRTGETLVTHRDGVAVAGGR